MLKRIVSKGKRLLRQDKIARFLRAPLRDNQVLYESFMGQSVGCNPYAIFRELIDDPRYAHLEHVWSVRRSHMDSPLVQQLRQMPRVRIVAAYSLDFYREVARSKYLINNTSFPQQFQKRPGQIYLNTWHGTPLKKMAYDLPGSRSGTRNVTRNLLSADYILSSSPYFTDIIWKSAYRLQGILPGRIVEDGYPRIDQTTAYARDRETTLRELAELGLAINPADRIVLFAPTWRGDNFADPEVGVDELLETVAAIQQSLPAGTRLIARVHQFAYDKAQDSPLRHHLMSNDIPANLILAVTDLLISDYSSIMVDSLALDRPIISHFVDYDAYLDERGLYPVFADFPAVVTKDLASLAEAVAAWSRGDDSLGEARARWHATYLPWEDGGAARRLVNLLFTGEHPRLVDIGRTNKPRVLLYAGGLQRNGITQSLLNLLGNLDPAALDLTILYRYSARNTTADSFPDWVRVLPVAGTLNQTMPQFIMRALINRRLLPGDLLSHPSVRAVFEGEARRLFGDAYFDHAIEYSGYSPLWTALIACAPATKKHLWLHADIRQDAEREVHGKHPHRKNLENVMRLYSHYDTLVSVSESLRDHQVESLARYSTPEQHYCVSNTLDAKRMHLLAEDDATEGLQIFADGTIPVGNRVFATVSRLSPEKNHERIIRAFAALSTDTPALSLLIVGDGPLRSHLEDVARELSVQESVIFTGYTSNPFAFLKRADCFVFASSYEGQGIALLEARYFDLPIVTTDFTVAAEVVPAEAGIIVPPTVEALAEGMRQYVAGQVNHEALDPAEYNRIQIQRMMRLIQKP